MSLKSAYLNALKNSKNVLHSQIDVKIYHEKHSQSLGAFFPSLSLNNTSAWREASDSGAYDSFQGNSYLSLVQPLFKGGAEYYARSASELALKSAEWSYKKERLDLLVIVAERFFQILSLEAQKKTLDQQMKTLEKRIKFLSSRAKIGRNKETDVLSARAQSARVLAELSDLELKLEQEKEHFKELTSISHQEDLKDSIVLKNLNPNEKLMNQALDNPEIKALKLSHKVSELEYKGTQSLYLPEFDMSANYYFERSGSFSDSSWDLMLTAKWNLFNGGIDASQRKINDYERKKKAIELEQTLRLVKSKYETLRLDFIKGKDVLNKLEKATSLAQKNLKLHESEANKGLVSDLDVLRVMDEYLSLKRAFIQREFQTKFAWIRLQAFSGVEL